MKILLNKSLAALNLTLTVVMLCSLSAHSAYAEEDVYVSDILVVNFRTGPGNEFRIDKRFKSGKHMVRLEVSEDGKWSKVRLNNGLEGYVLTQYLDTQESARIRLERTEQKASSLEQQLQQAKNLNKKLEADLASTATTANSASKNSAKLDSELKALKALSAGAIELDKRHNELLKKHQMIQTERDTLRAENENLKNDQRLSFLMYGAGILILGMILSSIIPMLKPKKGYSEWS